MADLEKLAYGRMERSRLDVPQERQSNIMDKLAESLAIVTDCAAILNRIENVLPSALENNKIEDDGVDVLSRRIYEGVQDIRSRLGTIESRLGHL